MKKYIIKNTRAAGIEQYHPEKNTGWLVTIAHAMTFDTEKEALEFIAQMKIPSWARYAVECIG